MGTLFRKGNAAEFVQTLVKTLHSLFLLSGMGLIIRPVSSA
jgi:hypothetical protein